RRGFTGPIYCTRRTAELAEIVLADSGRLQEEEAEYANHHHFSKHRPAEPLYTEADAQKTVLQFEPREFETSFPVSHAVHASFHPVGHILGSAAVLVQLDGNSPTSVLVSGDVGRPTHPILGAPAPPPAAATVIVESTYGDRQHESTDRALDRIADAITRTARRGGMTVIPSFAVDRTEIVLLALRSLMNTGRIPELPVYADSPMALDVLDVYRDAIRSRDRDVRPDMERLQALDRRHVHEVRGRDESIALNRLHVPSIIISASGMATGGRVLHHLARLLPDSRNTVVLAGYQAEATRGRLLANHAPSIKMLGRYVAVRAEIIVADAFSSHADANELTAWLAQVESPPDTVYVVHGEPDASTTFAQRLHRELDWNAVVPHSGERVILRGYDGP
ncbi:MAG TPA: MBL fold metallo-hydrolase, partial [Acidimicrobiia bacterium]|nr:MBL fold metallo-hydrolase [Acidimicrobiia bacterium]